MILSLATWEVMSFHNISLSSSWALEIGPIEVYPVVSGAYQVQENQLNSA